jgi:hypothetical protein
LAFEKPDPIHALLLAQNFLGCGLLYEFLMPQWDLSEWYTLFEKPKPITVAGLILDILIGKHATEGRIQGWNVSQWMKIVSVGDHSHCVDSIMPKMNGIDVVCVAREYKPELPAIIISGNLVGDEDPNFSNPRHDGLLSQAARSREIGRNDSAPFILIIICTITE